jgi:predicted AlkP superfamily pyrophosphatase or phosphodiesterase
MTVASHRAMRVGLAAVLLVGGSAPAVAEGPVLLVSVDGLAASWLNSREHRFQIPNLRRLMREGTHASGATSVMPPVTFPAHTTIITGVHPACHGIANNRKFAPKENGNEWYWSAADIKAPTLFVAAHLARKKTAAVTWPVTSTAPIDLLLPDFHPLDTLEKVFGMLDGKSGPPAVFQDLPLPRHLINMSDDLRLKVAQRFLDEAPDLLAVHLLEFDAVQHAWGRNSDEAIQALELVDTNLGRLFQKLQDTGRWEKTTVVVVSDHGFEDAKTEIRLGRMLQDAGLVQVESDGRAKTWRAWPWSGVGTVAIVVAPDATPEELRKVDRIVAQMLKDRRFGTRRALWGKQIVDTGGYPSPRDGRVHVVLEAKPTFYYSRQVHLRQEVAPAAEPGTHGRSPENPSLHAVFVARGPGIRKNHRIGPIHLTDMAPTIAHVLGVSLPNAQGRVLAEIFEPDQRSSIPDRRVWPAELCPGGKP